MYTAGHEYIVEFMLEHAETGYVNAQKDMHERVRKWQEGRKGTGEVYELLKWLLIDVNNLDYALNCLNESNKSTKSIRRFGVNLCEGKFPV